MLNLSKEEVLFLIESNYNVIIVAFFSIGITSFFLRKAWRKFTSDGSDIPGSMGLPFIGETLAFLSATNSTKGVYDFVRVRRKWYGKWFRTRVFGRIHVYVPTTEGARTIFSNDFVNFNKGYVKSMADNMGPESLFQVPHEVHKRIRRLLSDPFSMNSLSKFVKIFDKMVTHRLQKLQESGKSFRVHDFSMKITIDAMCNMLMSITEDSMLQQIENDISAVSDAMISIPFMIPGTRYYKGIKARTRLFETFGAMMERRRSGVECRVDFLQSMLERDSYPSDEKLTDTEIMDNLITLIIAGQTTTASAMMWSVKFLSDNKEALDKLREEQQSISRNKPDGDSLTHDDLNSMSYGLKVYKETLRMANVLMWFPRVALKDCTIEGFEIKKGWHVNIDATCIHYDPAVYKDPMQFKPLRFDEIQKPYSFIPFGSGPRTCLGMNQAKVMMLVFFHQLTTGYKWTLNDNNPCLEKKMHIPRLRSGCPITLKPLNDS